MVNLESKKVIITGASSGLGQAIAIAFAKAGADIVFSYQNNHQGAENTLAHIHQLGRKGLALTAQLQNTEELQAFSDKALNFLKGVDVLVNNAGTLTRHMDFMAISLDEYDLIQAVNIRAPFFLTQQVANVMIGQGTGGSIINISSISATVTSQGLAHYECSKAALNRLTQSTASALAKYHIRVNAIAPGLFATNLNADQHGWQNRCAHIPLQKAGNPEDITPLALLLASDDGALITGEIIAIDGGIALNSLLR